MNDFIKTIVETVTGKQSLADCSMTELKNQVDKYPFFAPAHFLLYQKTKKENGDTDDIAHDAIFFHHPAWHRLISLPVSHLIPITLNEEPSVETVNNFFSGKPITTEISAETEHKSAITRENIANHPGTAPAEAETNEDPATENVETESETELKIPALKLEAIDPATAPLSFTPYHTVDYFASQGIKLKTEAPPADQFEKQLRSFTEWLKTMKKLPATENDASISAKDEQKVTKMAGDSLTEEKVDTEAMAEVWIKQGQAEKARDIYRKLSLSNPSKSAYFAAKIENLK